MAEYDPSAGNTNPLIPARWIFSFQPMAQKPCIKRLCGYFHLSEPIIEPTSKRVIGCLQKSGHEKRRNRPCAVDGARTVSALCRKE